MTMMTRDCKNCGKTFTTNVSPSDITSGSKVHCSRVCANKFRNTSYPVDCKGCEVTFQSGVSESRKYCRMQCPGRAAGYLTSQGYIEFSSKDEYGEKLQHRRIMAQHLGRDLRANENVHHKNGNRADNRLDNLELYG